MTKLRMISDGDRMINLYIPSKRMRELFLWWLEQDSHDIKNLTTIKSSGEGVSLTTIRR